MLLPTIKEIESKTKIHYGKVVTIELTDNIFFNIFGIDLILPKGFKSDGNTFPFFIKGFISSYDPRWLFAGLVHDYIYRTQFIPKEIADLIYKIILLETSNKIYSYIFYQGVKKFGCKAWNRNGLKLVKYPQAIHDLKKHLCEGFSIPT